MLKRDFCFFHLHFRFFHAFEHLVKKIILSYLVQLAEENIALFTESLVFVSDLRDACFKVALVFSPLSGMLLQCIVACI